MSSCCRHVDAAPTPNLPRVDNTISCETQVEGDGSGKKQKIDFLPERGGNTQIPLTN
jgi:hypothetical protein